MGDAADELFQDETLSGGEAAVDEVVRRAGGERAAIRALLIDLAEARLAAAGASRGYLRGRGQRPT